MGEKGLFTEKGLKEKRVSVGLWFMLKTSLV